MNVVVMKYLTKKTVEGEPKTTFDDGPYGYWDFVGKGIIRFFIESREPKMNIARDLIFLHECSDVRISDEKMSKF